MTVLVSPLYPTPRPRRGRVFIWHDADAREWLVIHESASTDSIGRWTAPSEPEAVFLAIVIAARTNAFLELPEGE